MNFVYEPEVAAQIARVRQLRLAGEGRAGRRPRRSIRRRSRTRSSSRTTRCSARCSRLRPQGADQRGLQRAVAEGEGQRKPERMGTFFHRHRGPRRICCSPRGSSGSRSSSCSRSGSSATSRCRAASSSATMFTGSSRTTGTAIGTTTSSCPLVPLRGDRDGRRLLLSYPLVYWIAFRAALEEPLPARHHRAVLRHVPDPDARLASRSSPTRGLSSGAADLQVLGPTTADCWRRPSRPSSPASPTTSSPSWRCRSTSSLEQIDPRLLEAGQDLYASSPTQAFLRVTLPLSLPGVVRRHAAHVHSGGRRLHQRRSCSARRTRP